MAEIKVPSAQAVDAILIEMEEMILQPTDVARASRRLRAYIEQLRENVPRYAQPCDRHEYIEPNCPDCGKVVACG